MSPRLSIVVPFFDVGDYIGACLDSLARQTFTDFEAILVDDGSRDHSHAVAREVADRDPRFRIVRQENQGLGPARNTGVGHATGEYLAFVDSDDLVSRHGFEMMIRSLDATGSSLAAGDARRFNSSVVRESWIHRTPFAKDRPATHIFEHPELALDRMIWNKVFRRCFWDQHDFQFPAIRYEDYPVTLPAHVCAVTVDVLSAPVYYWRERESGDSITQLAHHFSNLEDRVRSAELVLDFADEAAVELIPRLHRHLAEIDLVALVQAFASSHGCVDEDEARLVALGRRFAGRLDPAVLQRASSYDQLQFHALRAGDVDLLRRLADFRLAGGLRGGSRARRHRLLPNRYEHEFPGVDDRSRSVPRALYRFDPRGFVLDSAVDDLRWEVDRLVVDGSAEIRHLGTSDRSGLDVTLVGRDVAVPLAVQRSVAVDSHGERRLVGFETTIDLATIMAAELTPLHLKLELRDGLVHRVSPLRGLRSGRPSYPAGRWVDGTTWVQPGRGADGRLQIWRYVDPWTVESLDVADDHLVFRGRAPVLCDPLEARMELTRATAAAGVPIELEFVRGSRISYVARIPVADVVDAANPDDPVTERTTRLIEIVAGGAGGGLVATGLTRDVTVLHDERMIIVTRSAGNRITIVESRVQVVAEEVTATSDDQGMSLTVGGPERGGGMADAFVWRHFPVDRDTAVEVECKRVSTPDGWLAVTTLSDLAEAVATDARATVPWTLFAVGADGEARPVQTSHHLSTHFPITAEAGGRSVVVRPRADTFHAEVR